MGYACLLSFALKYTHESKPHAVKNMPHPPFYLAKWNYTVQFFKKQNSLSYQNIFTYMLLPDTCTSLITLCYTEETYMHALQIYVH